MQYDRRLELSNRRIITILRDRQIGDWENKKKKKEIDQRPNNKYRWNVERIMRENERRNMRQRDRDKFE